MVERLRCSVWSGMAYGMNDLDRKTVEPLNPLNSWDRNILRIIYFIYLKGGDNDDDLFKM